MARCLALILALLYSFALLRVTVYAQEEMTLDELIAALTESINSRDYPRCVALATEILDPDPLTSPLTNEHRAAYLAYRASCFYRIGNLSRALTDLNVALLVYPNSLHALQVRGDIHRSEGEYALALEDLDAAIALNPESSTLFGLRGDVWRLLYNEAKALLDLNAALELNPDNLFALARRGDTYRHMNEYDAALADLNAALESQPNYIFALNSRGTLYRTVQEFELAIEDFNALLELDPDSVSTLGNRGDMYRMLGEYDLALADLNAALTIDPDDVFALRIRGDVYRHLGEYDLALASLNASLEIDEHSAFVWAVRGAVKAALGQYLSAQSDLETALRTDPSYVFAQQQLELVYPPLTAEPPWVSQPQPPPTPATSPEIPLERDELTYGSTLKFGAARGNTGTYRLVVPQGSLVRLVITDCTYPIRISIYAPDERFIVNLGCTYNRVDDLEMADAGTYTLHVSAEMHGVYNYPDHPFAGTLACIRSADECQALASDYIVTEGIGTLSVTRAD